jgi:prophage tail gpP-like protein
MADDGDLTITSGGQTLGGWEDIEVAVGIEVCPWLFNIRATEKFSETSSSVILQPGDPCTVQIGRDLVMTGWVDRLKPSIRGKKNHFVGYSGRSKSQDAVDCSAEWPGGQINGSSVLEIANKLLQPYGITVEGQVDTGPPIPQFNLTIGESAYSIIERLARFRGLLIYDLPNGNLVLAQAGSDIMGSGMKQGENIQDADADYSMDQRFSDYEAFITAVDTLSDLGNGGNLLATTTDPGVKRHRLRTIISEGGALGNDVAKKRAIWEAARRAGRSNVVIATVDSWRDTDGKLWTPNAIIPIDAPALKLPDGLIWIISQVTFKRDRLTGTTAIIQAMPQAAFLPEPILLQPLPGDVMAATAP